MKYPLGCAAAFVMLAFGAGAGTAQTTATGSAAEPAGFGRALAIGDDEIFVAEPDNRARPGLVHVYRRTATGWALSNSLQAANAEASDRFGQQLVLSGNTLFVGVPTSGENRGTVHVFERRGGEWIAAGQLTPADLTANSMFGSAIAVDGDVALISAPGRNGTRGGVYVYRRTGDTWTQAGELTVPGLAPRSAFGADVALTGGTAFVGVAGANENRGAVEVFTAGGDGAWSHTGSLPAPELQPNSRFGIVVRAEDGVVLVSAPLAGNTIGAMYTYVRGSDGTWMQQATLSPEPATPNTMFGLAAVFDGRQLLVGASPADTARGAVFYAARNADGTFGPLQRLTPAEPLARGDRFGGAVAMRGNVAAATMSGDDHGLGSVVVFERSGGAWTQTAVLKGETEALASVTGDEVRCTDGVATQFNCRDVEMLSFLSIPDLGGGRGVRLNDIWGWTDPQTGKEYALVGRIDGMSVVDVSNPVSPVFVADLPLTEGANPASWRDIKVYRDHAFIVADGAGPHGMQVLDLTKVRAFDGTPLHLEADTVYHNINSAHNIVINEESGFAYIVGARQGGETCGGGLHMVDIREPKRPSFAGCFADPQTGRASTGYSHDAQCVMYHGPDTRYQGHEICIGSNETAISIADVTDKANPRPLSRASYPNVGYTHQGWFDEEHRYLYVNDELDEVNGLVTKTRTLVWDLADLEDPQLVKEHLGVAESSDHNLYIEGDLMYQSNYKSGLRILDISDRVNPHEVAFFKTFPGDDASPGFSGSWSNYPYFESGIIVVSSIGEGLFVLKKRDTSTVF